MTILPPDYLMSDEDILVAAREMYPKYLAYTKIHEGERDLAIAAGASADHVARHEDELRSFRRVCAQQYRLIQLLAAVEEKAVIPPGAGKTDEEVRNAEPIEPPAESGGDLSGLFGFDV